MKPKPLDPGLALLDSEKRPNENFISEDKLPDYFHLLMMSAWKTTSEFRRYLN